MCPHHRTRGDPAPQTRITDMWPEGHPAGTWDARPPRGRPWRVLDAARDGRQHERRAIAALNEGQLPAMVADHRAPIPSRLRLTRRRPRRDGPFSHPRLAWRDLAPRACRNRASSSRRSMLPGRHYPGRSRTPVPWGLCAHHRMHRPAGTLTGHRFGLAGGRAPSRQFDRSRWRGSPLPRRRPSPTPSF
jgi:hypothetical protein